MIAVLILFLMLLVLVIGHELGHFLIAKWNNVRVDEFGFGIPPKLWGYQPADSETEYSVNWLPIGGFVRLYGQDGDNRHDPRSFAAKKPWQKIAILSGGVIMNFLMAIVLFSSAAWIGYEMPVGPDQVTENTRHIIGYVEPDSPAQESGLQQGDQLQAIAGQNVTYAGEVGELLQEASSDAIEIAIIRDEKEQTISVKPTFEDGELQPIGVLPVSLEMQKLSFLEGLSRGLQQTAGFVIEIMTFLSDLVVGIFTTQENSNPSGQVMGPVGLAEELESLRQYGFGFLLNITAALSVNLAVINLLPIPALDGGRIVMIVTEWIKGSPLNQQLEAQVIGISFIVILGLTLFITANDIIRLVG